MNSFQKNLQRFFVFFFTVISLAVIFVGINRIKKTSAVTEVPQQESINKDTSASSVKNTPASPGVVTTYTGKTYQTPWGNVVASIQVKDNEIVGVTMPKVPNSNPSIYAKPYLINQAIKAGGANIQGVSGATYTSIAFKSSLESALVKAGTQGTKNIQTPAPQPSVPRTYRDSDDN